MRLLSPGNPGSALDLRNLLVTSRPNPGLEEVAMRGILAFTFCLLASTGQAAEIPPAGVAASAPLGGHVASVSTPVAFYLGGESAQIDVVLATDGTGSELAGNVWLLVAPHLDPLGAGDGEMGPPILDERRSIQLSANPSAPAAVTQRFEVVLPAAPTLYHAVALWQPLGTSAQEPVASSFGVRPDLPEVPEDILTFTEVSVDASAIAAALHAYDLPKRQARCQPGTLVRPALQNAGPPPLPGLLGLAQHLLPQLGQRRRCGATTRVAPEPIRVPLGAQRSAELRLHATRFLIGAPEELDQRFYRGAVADDPERKVRLTLSRDRVYVTLHEPDGGQLHIEPLSDYASNAPSQRYIAYHSDAVRSASPTSEHSDQAPPSPGGDTVGNTHLGGDATLFRLYRLRVYKDGDFSSMHYLADVAEVFERDLKIMLRTDFAGTIDTDAYEDNDYCNAATSFWTDFQDDAAQTSSLDVDGRILFTNNPSHDYDDTTIFYGYNGLLGCGGGDGDESTRAAWVLRRFSGYQVESVVAHELGHTLGASHDCGTSAGTHHHWIGAHGGFGTFAHWHHDAKTIMCSPYPGDSHLVQRFSGETQLETLTDAHRLVRSMHYWSGESADDKGLELQEFWLMHDSFVDGPDGPFNAGYTVVHGGEGLFFWNWHLAIDPEPGPLLRGYLTGAIYLDEGDALEYEANGNFDSHDRFDLWEGAEVWPDYRWLDVLSAAHRTHWHTGPPEWNGEDFEL